MLKGWSRTQRTRVLRALDTEAARLDALDDAVRTLDRALARISKRHGRYITRLALEAAMSERGHRDARDARAVGKLTGTVSPVPGTEAEREDGNAT